MKIHFRTICRWKSYRFPGIVHALPSESLLFRAGTREVRERCRGLDPRDFPKALDASESFHGSEDVRFLPLCAGEAYGVQLYRIPPGESRELGECFGDEERSTPYEDLVAKDLRLLVDMIVETMPPQRRMIYRMSRNEGLSNTEIAENLQLSKDRGKTFESSVKGIAERSIDFPSCYDMLMN